MVVRQCGGQMQVLGALLLLWREAHAPHYHPNGAEWAWLQSCTTEQPGCSHYPGGAMGFILFRH